MGENLVRGRYGVGYHDRKDVCACFLDAFSRGHLRYMQYIQFSSEYPNVFRRKDLSSYKYRISNVQNSLL